ncbi:MAG: hypothetical protein N3B01_10860 [Verrucomicrobiae bacterium]|nr:hypothetical protein [Verrucomicrobiae bacterium]
MNAKIPRRKFFKFGLCLSAAGLGGCERPPLRAEKPPRLDARFTYDVSRFERIDPSLLCYEEKTSFAVELQEPTCLATTGAEILVGGDRLLKRFDRSGRLLGAIRLPDKPVALDPLEDGSVRVGFRDRWSVFDRNGAAVSGCEPLGERVRITALAHAGSLVFVADAGNREVLRCDATGRVLSRLKGFIVPSPYFDLCVSADGRLWVVNPGKHRVEAYTFDGQYLTGWGSTAMLPEGFCGCCNPVYFARLPDGRFVTSEKGLVRVKVYHSDGRFECVVAGPEQLVKDRELARKACANCQVGFGLPVAADEQGRVLILDVVLRRVRIFERREKTA